MRWAIVVAIGLMPAIALAEDLLPKRPDFSRYQTMLNHSFAIATAVTSDSVKDLYVASIDFTGNDCVVTLRSTTDRNFKKELPAKCTLPVNRLNERDFSNIYMDLRP